MKVRVYRNVNNGMISIMSLATRKVIAHANSVSLVDCEFEVNAKGRDKVRAEGRKNVHAYVTGTLAGWQGLQAYKGRLARSDGSPMPVDQVHHFSAREERHLQGVQVTYNPYKTDFFQGRDSGVEIHKARKVTVTCAGRITAWVHRFTSEYKQALAATRPVSS